MEPCSHGMLLMSFPAQLYMSMLGFDDLPGRYASILVSSRYKAARRQSVSLEDSRRQMQKKRKRQRETQHTYSSTVWCSSNKEAVQVQVEVEYGRVERRLAIESIANFLPASGGMRLRHLQLPTTSSSTVKAS